MSHTTCTSTFPNGSTVMLPVPRIPPDRFVALFISSGAHIGPFVYKVEKRAELRNDEGQELFGESKSANKVITISEKYDSDHQFVTLLHEIIHAIAFVWSLDLSESAVTSLSMGLAQALKGAGVVGGAC